MLTTPAILNPLVMRSSVGMTRRSAHGNKR